MATPSQAAGARVGYLSSIATLYARDQPHIAAYWGAELNDLKTDSGTHVKVSSNNGNFCRACGCLQINGKTSKVRNTEQTRERHPSKLVRSKNRLHAASETERLATMTTCLHCHRFSKDLTRPEPKKIKTLPIQISQPSTTPSKQPQLTSTSTTDNWASTKSKRKQKKGGLAAMLARSKETSVDTKTFALADFAKKT